MCEPSPVAARLHSLPDSVLTWVAEKARGGGDAVSRELARLAVAEIQQRAQLRALAAILADRRFLAEALGRGGSG